MNIAIISPEYPPFTNWGGIATFNYNLVQLLAKMGHKVYVFTTTDQKNNKTIFKKDGKNINLIYVPNNLGNKFLNFVYYYFPLGIIRAFLQKYFPTLLLFFEWNIFSSVAFSRLKRDVNFHCIHTPAYSAPAFLISLFNHRIPLVIHSQGPQELFNLYQKRTLDLKIKELIENFYLTKFPKIVVACSENVKEYLVGQFKNIEPKVIYIPNFIATKKLKNRSKLNLNRILFLGRFEKRKGPDLVLQTFLNLAKNYSNLELTFLGEDCSDWTVNGKDYASFKNWADSLNSDKVIRNRIKFRRRIDDRQELINFLNRNKGIAILPSRYEPFGFVFIEVMASGYVTVASNSGGAKEIIDHGVDGFLVHPEVSTIQEALIKLLKMPASKLKKMSKEATIKVDRNYSSEAVLVEYKKLYNRLFTNKKISNFLINKKY